MKAYQFREAQLSDLPELIKLLAEDPLGAKREDATMPPNEQYRKAFEKILNDPQATLYVAEDDHRIIAMAQIHYLQYLTYQGGVRAQIEGVRVHQDYRGQGIGRKLFEFLIEQAKQHDCHVVQLTTDKARPDALKFYESLGFQASHIGMKLHIKK